ncbi:MAG TPA: peptidase T [Bdellovibrionota bacterium]|nr:peptidase T [Bdellovibrionota bacterium]
MSTNIPNSKRLVERFLKYVRISSGSKDGVDRFPSTPEQLEIGKILVRDLKEMGLSDASMDEHGYVFATLPGNLPPGRRAPVVGLLAHVDTYPGVSGKDVKPIVHEGYDGRDIVLPGDPEQVIRVNENPELAHYTGRSVITSDGTTLLGADDKAGIAEIMEAIACLQADPDRLRPTVRVGFTPDEEIGNGTAHFDLKRFGADFAYTADGSAADEVEDETFCADTAIVTIKGRDVHPGYAKGKMVNAVRLASKFLELVPSGICAEHTSGREGYLHPTSITGDVSQTKITFIVRDFSIGGLAEKEKFLRTVAESLMREVPHSSVELEIKESYRNMKLDLEKNPEVVRRALKAVEKVGLKPKLTSIRGGTDGSRLSVMGLLTPNMCGGGKNFHSKQEWIAVPVLEDCTRVLIELVYSWSE